MLSADVIGHIGADAEIKEISGKRYTAFSVAHKKYIKDSEGNKTDQVQWVSVLWYGDGHGILQYLKKGAKVFVRGNQDIRIYQPNNKEPQISITINAEKVVLCAYRDDYTPPKTEQ